MPGLESSDPDLAIYFEKRSGQELSDLLFKSFALAKEVCLFKRFGEMVESEMNPETLSLPTLPTMRSSFFGYSNLHDREGFENERLGDEVSYMMHFCCARLFYAKFLLSEGPITHKIADDVMYELCHCCVAGNDFETFVNRLRELLGVRQSVEKTK